MIKTRTRIFVSNKGIMLEDKINNALDELEKEGYLIKSVSTEISYAGERGYMVMGTIVYEEEILSEMDFNFGDRPFGFSESLTDPETSKA